MAHSDPFQQETGLDLDDLILFWHIVQQGHFGRAARVMGFSQPKVSRKVWKLEKYFGTTLMLRGTKGVILTSTGKEVLEMARGVVEKVHAMRARSNDHKNEMRGEISIICAPGFTRYWLLPVIKAFCVQHADVSFRFTTNGCGNGDLTVGEADIAISSFLPDALCGVERRTLCVYPLHLYAAGEYLERRGIPQSMDDLAKHDIVTVYDQASDHIHPMVNQILLDAGHRTPKAFASNEASMVDALSEGLGISFIPSFFGDRTPELRKLDSVEHPRITHTKYISWNEATCETARHRAFLSFIKEKVESSEGFDLVWAPV